MPLINRLSHLFKADFHAVLDRLEEPDVILRQAVREMEESLASDQQRLKLFLHEEKTLGAQYRDLESGINRLGDELDICLDSDEDHLARNLIRRRLQAEQGIKMLSTRRDSLKQSVADLQAQIGEHQSQLNAMRQKAELVSEQYRQQPGDQGDSSHTGWPVQDFSVQDEDVEVALLAEKQRRASR